MADPTKAQLQTEHTGEQATGWAGGSLLYASGGCATNPCAFPGYGSLYGRTYTTYRWMLQHPIVRLVRAISTAPILASHWKYTPANDKVSQEWVDVIGQQFDRIRQRAVSDILRGRDYGWAGFEPLWEVRDGVWTLNELKPLTGDITTILTDKGGRFAGLTQGLKKRGLNVDTQQGQTDGLPAPYKAWVYTYDRECGNLYGRSWLENIRETAWKDWLDCAQQLQKLSGSLAGTQIIGKSPSSMKEAFIAMVKAMANGAIGGWVPSMLNDPKPGDTVDVEQQIELAKASIIDWELLDFGNRSAAIAGILARMQHAEELMFAGGLRPSRSGLEGQHGTKAEAGVHTDTGMLCTELDDDDIAQQLQPMVDAVGALNWAGYKPGDVFIDPPPLVDTKSQKLQEFLKLLMGNPTIATAIAKYANVPEVLTGLDYPVQEGAKFEIADPEPAAPAPKAASPRLERITKRLTKATSR